MKEVLQKESDVYLWPFRTIGIYWLPCALALTEGQLWLNSNDAVLKRLGALGNSSDSRLSPLGTAVKPAEPA